MYWESRCCNAGADHWQVGIKMDFAEQMIQTLVSMQFAVS